MRVDQGLTLAIMALHLTMPCTRMLFMSEEWAATSPFPYFVGYDDRVLRLIHGVYVNMSPRTAVMVSGKVSSGLL